MKLQEIYERLKKQFPEVTLQETKPDGFIIVKKEDIHPVCKFLKDDPQLKFDFLTSLCGVDDGEALWVVYHLYSIKHRHQVVLKVRLSREDPRIRSISDIWQAANWHEREGFDLVGINFQGHPNLKRILLPEDWEGHPLRKDYKFPTKYHGITLE
jgi:NADH-quinone oxidoreductase subunit C